VKVAWLEFTTEARNTRNHKEKSRKTTGVAPV